MNKSGIEVHVFRHLWWFQTRLEAAGRLPLGDFNGPQESTSIKMMEWHYSLSASSEGEIDKLHSKKRERGRELFVGCVLCKGRFPRFSTLGTARRCPGLVPWRVCVGTTGALPRCMGRIPNGNGKKARKAAGYPSKRSLQKFGYVFENVCYHLFSA